MHDLIDTCFVTQDSHYVYSRLWSFSSGSPPEYNLSSEIAIVRVHARL
jgi:hypothetical protein